jgi:Trk K+ transport system NAD-binding subunit
MFNNLQMAIRYRLSELFARRTWAPYALLLTGTISLVLLGGLVLHLAQLFAMSKIESDAEKLPDSIQQSLNYVLDPNTIVTTDYKNPSVYAAGIIITLLGIIFTSALIGLISSSLIDRMARLRQGVTMVKERDHILLLGWSLRALSIVRYFTTRKSHCKVVILSSVLPDDIDVALRSVGLNRSKLPLVIRTGDSTVTSELERVSIKNAAAIIVVSSTSESLKSADVDAAVIKTLMTIKSYFSNSPMPNTVAEIADRAHRDVADVATGQTIPYLIRNDIESRLLVQLCRYPGLGYVLAEIWGYSDLNIELCPVSDFTGRTITRVAQNIVGAAVIGVCWKEPDGEGTRDAIVLNPPADYELEHDDMLILISSMKDRVKEISAKHTETAPIQRMSAEQQYLQYPRRLLILGYNEAIDEVISEYDIQAFRGGEIHLLCGASEIAGIDLDPSQLTNTQLVIHEGDTWRREPLSSVDPASFDAILVLAEPESTGENNDAITVLTLLLLNDIFGNEPRPNIICQISNNSNRALIVPALADDLIVSPDVISIPLARISEEPLLGRINKELSSLGGVELALRAISDYALGEGDMSYARLQAAAYTNNETAIGILTAGKVEMYPASDRIFPQDGDFKVIVLAHQIFA